MIDRWIKLFIEEMCIGKQEFYDCYQRKYRKVHTLAHNRKNNRLSEI